MAVALRTAPLPVSGLDEGVARALTSIERVTSPPLRAEAVDLTAVWNPWEFHGPALPSDTVTTVGRAVRRRHLLRYDLSTADGSRARPSDPGFVPTRSVEPHHLVLWAGSRAGSRRPTPACPTSSPPTCAGPATCSPAGTRVRASPTALRQ